MATDEAPSGAPRSSRADRHTPMAESRDVRRLRRGYEAFNRGDLDTVLRNVAPDVELRDREEIPDPGVYHGLDEAREVLVTNTAEFEGYRIEPEEFIEVGEHIVVVARQSGRGRTSGAEVVGTIVHAWHVRDGRVLRMRAFSDRQEALEAVGAGGSGPPPSGAG
jgi:ketosteroid isomerase-like protein